MNEDLEKGKKLLAELNSLRRKMNQDPLKLSDAETIKQLKSLPGDIKNARAALADMLGTASDLYDRIKNITSEIKGQENPMTGIRRAFRNITADASKLKNDELEIERLTSKELANLEKRVKKYNKIITDKSTELATGKDLTALQKEEVDTIADMAKEFGGVNDLTLQQREQVLDLIQSTDHLSDEQKAILSNYYDQSAALTELEEKARERLKVEEEIDKKVRGFSVLSDLANSIPGLRQFAGPFKEAEKAAREVAEEGGTGLEIFAAGGKKLLAAFGPITLLVTAFNFLKDVAFNVSKQTTEIGKSMGISAENSRDFRSQLVEIQNTSKDIFNTTANLVKAQGELSQAYGATRGFTQQQLKDQILLTERAGLQAESAAKIAMLSSLTGQSSEDSLKNVISQTAALEKASGIRLDDRQVLEDVAEVNGQIAATLGNNPGRIAAAVVQTRRLGLTLEQARSISKDLLDFESSIESELEAELLTGKELNLERARALALQGDFAGSAAEVAKQAGSLAEFNSMNVLAQEALADAAGLSVDELADSLAYTENLNKLGAQSKDLVEQRVKFLKEQGRVEEANRLAQSIGNEKEALEAIKKVDAQTKFNQALEKAKSIFADLFVGSENIADSIANFVSAIAQSIPLIKTAGVVMGVLAARSIYVAIANAFATGGATAIGGAVAMGISAVVLGGMAAFSGGSSKSDSLTPSSGKETISGKDVELKLLPEDTIITQAGTKLGRTEEMVKELKTNNELLKQLINSKGHVYMDGNKVGQALVLSSYQSS